MRRWIAGAATLLPLLGVVSARAATAPPAGSLGQGALFDLPSVVLVINDEGGSLRKSDGSTYGPYEMSFIGTGFFISSDGYLVTAAHVAAPSANDIKSDLVNNYIDYQYNCDPSSAPDQCAAVEALHHDAVMRQMTAYHTSVHLHVLTQNLPGTSDGLPATLAASSPSASHDVAVLKVSGHNEPVSLLGSTAAVTAGDPVATLGYPSSTENGIEGFNVVPTLTEGHILGRVHGDATSPAAQKANLFEFDAPIEQGNSGGPGLSTSGTVDGIVTFGDVGANDNYMVTADDVKAVVAKTKAQNKLGTIDGLYRRALAARASGDVTLANSLFDQCAALNPAQVYCATRGQSSAGTYALDLKPMSDMGPYLTDAQRTANARLTYQAGRDFSTGLAVLTLGALLFSAYTSRPRRREPQKEPPPDSP
jgi:S1-C subfamily serine protease